MHDPDVFLKSLIDADIELFVGVPDSLLSGLISAFESNNKICHLVAANEGNALALAAGYHLATNKLPLVYMQNSGFGNIINPYLSLTCKQVYQIPMIIIMGWRGCPEKNDEPQHLFQGKVQIDLLKTLDIPFVVLDENFDSKSMRVITKKAIQEKRAVCILIKKGAFITKPLQLNAKMLPMNRRIAISIIVKYLPENSVVIATTGKIAREAYDIMSEAGKRHQLFMNVGAMGHCSSVALGLAIGRPEVKVICLDGDGALIMHMGALSLIGKVQCRNFYHILLNNGCHESVGGCPSAADTVDFLGVAKASSYNSSYKASSEGDMNHMIDDFFEKEGPVFLEAKISLTQGDDPSRPSESMCELKSNLQDFLQLKGVAS